MPLTHEMRFAMDAWEQCESDRRILSKYRCGTCPPYRFCPWTCVAGAVAPDVMGSGLAVSDAEAGYGMDYDAGPGDCADCFHVL